jgi:hypothetical protein
MSPQSLVKSFQSIFNGTEKFGTRSSEAGSLTAGKFEDVLWRVGRPGSLTCLFFRLPFRFGQPFEIWALLADPFNLLSCSPTDKRFKHRTAKGPDFVTCTYPMGFSRGTLNVVFVRVKIGKAQVQSPQLLSGQIFDNLRIMGPSTVGQPSHHTASELIITIEVWPDDIPKLIS